MTTIRNRRGTASEWTTANPVLALGEIGIETDTRKLKAGDGTTVWNSLGYVVGSGGGGGGPSSWGDITGSLSSQTDLQSALDAKVSSSGLSELVDDRVAALLVAGTNVTLNYNDSTNTITISTSSSNNSYFPQGW